MKILLISLLSLKVTLSIAQVGINFGNEGMTVKAGTVLSFEELALTPATELQVNATSLYKTNIPVTINSKKGINYVYRFINPVNFKGNAQINFQLAELNGNIKAKLQIAHSTNELQGFTLVPGTVGNNFVHADFTNFKLKTLTSGESISTALPVTLINFSLSAESEVALLKWATTIETGASHFEIEHSNDAKSWKKVGTIAAAGESSETKTYQFVDVKLEDGTNYYRLKMMDRDGSFAYSVIKSIAFTLPEIFTIYPNPASDRIQIKFSFKSQIIRVAIYDQSGSVRYGSTTFPKEGISVTDFPPGRYTLTVIDETGKRSSQPFIKM